MTISQYLESLQSRYKTGIATEHTYRGYLQTLLESIAQGVTVTNEPARIKCGAPDYILTRKEIPVGYIEAKDIGKDIRHKDYKEQFERYKKSLNNLIITDYLEFELYIDGEFKTKVSIAKIEGLDVKPLPENFEEFTTLIRSFCTYVGQTIKSSQKLATMMADKAKLLSQVIEKALNSDVENEANSSLKDQMYAFKDILIHDIKPREFADIYAQTIAYGMFAARLHDTTLNDFSRQEAAELIPKTNPFLRKLFQYVAGYDLDSRIVWIVDALADIFRATDVASLLKNFGSATQTHDPIIHFYETFLAEYDPALRKARGVWYTPEPVVNFIVRAVDDILKSEFNLPNGLADNSKIKIKRKSVTKATADQRSKLKEVETEVEVHKVQILDPATGTGTFLAEIVKHIYNKYRGQQGIWSSYVENHLIPRLNGFELLMASYAMAHLKMDLLLKDTGYKPTREQRFRIYLTNSLEEHHVDTGTLFANWLSSEANEANHIKRDTPVMVVMGNPPYSGESANKGEWIMNLMEDYKKEPGGKEKLKERNPKWINDDYVKFLRYGQHFIEKNGEGILAFINPHGFLDNPTFRGMRWNLLKTYDKIYTIDLHGNGTKKEVSPDGTIDVNVFDIMQGVSINIFIKKGSKSKSDLATFLHFDLFGRRDYKYNFLSKESINSIPFKKIIIKSPMYFMVDKNLDTESFYEKGFKLDVLFVQNNLGFVTARDSFTIHNSITQVRDIVEEFLRLDDESARNKFSLGKDVRDWQVNYARKDLINHYPNKGKFVKISYRPFDEKYTYYTGKSKGFHCYPRNEIMQHMLHGENIALNLCKIGRSVDSHIYFVSKFLTDKNLVSSLDSVNTFPIYLYNQNHGQLTTEENSIRVPNFNKELIQQIAATLALTFTDEKGQNENSFAPIDLLDYIYAVLHSPTYREKYKEFLKIDFPRVPYPNDVTIFWHLVKLGGEIRQLHLLESAQVDNYITTYPEGGDNVLVAPKYDNGRAYINPTQYFDGVPQSTWNFYIGGYQPAQKWLKDRKGRELSFDDILHYQRMIVALSETERIMGEIDKIDFE
nr:type ISP restriction/modification enzyme [uncultured Mucilaginibacter sp.]